MILRNLPLFLALALAGCGDKDAEQDTAAGPNETTDSGDIALSDACTLAAENSECDDCDDGDVTCTYGDHSVTQASCGGCQAEAALYQALCDAGVTDSAADIQAGMECGLAVIDACVLAEEYAACDECADGDVTCTYEDVSETAMSCADCQAKGKLYATLCDIRIDHDKATIEAGTECVPAE